MNKNFFIATIAPDGQFLVYESERFKLEEIDLINLIKICMVERRNVNIGRRLLDVYEDSKETDKEAEDAKLKLSLIGINSNGNKKPTQANRTNKK